MRICVAFNHNPRVNYKGATAFPSGYMKMEVKENQISVGDRKNDKTEEYTPLLYFLKA